MKKRFSKAIIIYWEKRKGDLLPHEEGGIFNRITYREAAEALGDSNIVYFLPLEVSGYDYESKKTELADIARVWQESNTEFINWSYGELAIIQSFFETQGRRYGLTKEFKENGII